MKKISFEFISCKNKMIHVRVPSLLYSFDLIRQVLLFVCCVAIHVARLMIFDEPALEPSEKLISKSGSGWLCVCFLFV